MAVVDWVPEGLRQKLLDKLVTAGAGALEQVGVSERAVEFLRTLRSDRPFTEDVVDAMIASAADLRTDGRISDAAAAFIIGKCDTDSVSVAANLSEVLFTAQPSLADAARRFVTEFISNQVDGSIVLESFGPAVLEWVQEIRNRLYAHEKLIELQRLNLDFVRTEATVRMVEVASQNAAASHRVAAALEIIAGSSAAALPTTTRQELASLADVRGTSHGEEPAKTTSNAHVGPSHRVNALSDHTWGLPDILTPSIDGLTIAAAYGPVVGDEAATWLAEVQRRVIKSIEGADFEEQDRIADELVSNNLGLLKLTIAGHYLNGEAHRLMADMADAPELKSRLMAQAINSYETARELSPTDTRALRGLARSLEVTGEVGKALDLFQRAHFQSLNDFWAGETPSNETVHEVLRATRHYAASIVDAIEQNPQSTWATEEGLVELRGIVQASSRLHKSNLPKFAANADWMNIEWFMGLVLLAKGYAQASDTEAAWRSLIFALQARVTMIDPTSDRTRVELANLHWWIATARKVPGLTTVQRQRIELLAEAVDTGRASRIAFASNALVAEIRAPWTG